MKTIIKNYVVRDRHFIIVLNGDGFYLAIEDKHLTNGRLNKPLNGAQMYASRDLDICLGSVKNCVDIDYYISCGDDRATAYSKVFNIPAEKLQGVLS